MNNYSLKDKIHVTKEFLDEVTSKSWQEIEYLQNQISNIEAVTEQDKKFVQLLNSLLTNYYIFIGGIENLSSNDISDKATITNKPADAQELLIHDEVETFDGAFTPDLLNSASKIQISNDAEVGYEPFEYFVDFDEPIGEKLTDEDLYGN